ncbi:hypothetical protein Y11_12611 [Yersinia enterocolitica subsp. palearctica Y11]|uniref:Uncharacterized protein n=2 Tax=Yersinia enterocolitica TaxID=630 RepID=A0A0H3NPA6_YERE1|nr:unknown protein [Yersinia enterocolitica W22703]CBY26920.1 hypothetical protein Y11_12611 [Yersinia enterocolitica subsp. palearctica Y11]CCO68365.1 hypothetical protein D322_1491 [Yersinia enterocolitica IP 10393]
MNYSPFELLTLSKLTPAVLSLRAMTGKLSHFNSFSNSE